MEDLAEKLDAEENSHSCMHQEGLSQKNTDIWKYVHLNGLRSDSRLDFVLLENKCSELWAGPEGLDPGA